MITEKGRLAYVRCIKNPRFENVIENLMERQHQGNPFKVRGLRISTTQTLPDPITVHVPALNLLEGGLREGRYRFFNKLVTLEDRRYDAAINLQELSDEFNSLFAFDEKLASHLVVDELILLDYSAIGQRTDQTGLTVRTVCFKRMQKRKLPEPMMKDSKINDKACLKIALDAVWIKDYTSRPSDRQQTITDNPSFADSVDPIDLPTLAPAIFDRPVKDDCFIEYRNCWIPADDPMNKGWCVTDVEMLPRQIRDLLGKGDVVDEEEE